MQELLSPALDLFRFMGVGEGLHSVTPVMDAAREAGADGGTILLARGTGVHEAKRFFGISVSSEKELLLILMEPERVRAVLDAVVRSGRLDEPARGVAFVLSVNEVTGIAHRGM